MVMKRKAARMVAGTSAALGLVSFASAANAAVAPAHGPTWHVVYTQSVNAEFEAVVATGKTSGFAFLEPNTTVAVPSAYERTGATTFKKVPSPPWRTSGLPVRRRPDRQPPQGGVRGPEVDREKFSVVADFSGELSGGTVLSPDDVYAYGSTA
jgi:hypothetical protein